MIKEDLIERQRVFVDKCKKRGYCCICYTDIEPNDPYFNVRFNDKFYRLCVYCNKKGPSYFEDMFSQRVVEWKYKINGKV